MTLNIDNSPGEAQARRLEAMYAQLAALLGQPEVAQRLRTTPGEKEWSAMQILGHVAEMIPYWLSHCRAISATTTEPPVFGRTLAAPERLAGVEQGATADPAALLGLLNEAVQAAGRAIRGMSPVERSKKGIHVSRGEMSVADVIEAFIVAHAEDHLAQVQTALRG